MAEPEGYKMLSGDLKPGKKMKGCLVYEVSPGWKKFEVSYQELGNTDSLDFELTPGDLSQ